jgi:hypothetical protein
MVMFGGFGVTSLADTWEWDGVDWVDRQPATSPAARHGHALAFDFVVGRTILFGGLVGLGGGDANAETWAWDGTDWTQLTLPVSPLPRSGQTMTWARGQVVLYGGKSPLFVNHFDVWELGASSAQIGSGCPGSNGTPVLAAVSPLRIGGAFTTVLRGLAPAATIAAIASGVSTTSWRLGLLPADLTPFGLTGCTLFVSTDVVSVLPVVGGAATLTVDVPVSPLLVGQAFHQQGLSIDPGVNAAGAVVSNAIGSVARD